jgi:proton-translocating NADH-quinone oxidoreductase chain M
LKNYIKDIYEISELYSNYSISAMQCLEINTLSIIQPSISTLILLPLLGIIIILLGNLKKSVDNIKIGLFFSISTFILSMWLLFTFDKSVLEFQFVEQLVYLPEYNINVYLGIDGISLFFVILTTLLISLCLLYSVYNVRKYIKEYVICLLLMESILIGTFSVLDILLFYILFESILIPMFLFIGIWGSRTRKIHAAYQLFFYTMIGSVLMLFSIIIIYFHTGTTDVQILSMSQFSNYRQIILWFSFFIAFAIKVPMIPFHIWLPEAHVEAPTAGSVLLAGVLLKLGTYGLVRFSIPMFPDASVYFIPLVLTISIISILYASLTTIRQVDLKKIIAYSSVAHMSYVTLGMFSLNIEGLEGSLFLMVSHGLVSSALFICIGCLYDRYHTRILKYYRGLVHTMPIFTTIFLLFTFSNMSLPGTSSFIGELLILMGLCKISTFMTVLAVIGTIFGAVYCIWLFNRIVYGDYNTTYIYKYMDLNRVEIYVLGFLFLNVIILGIFPDIILSYFYKSVLNLVVIFS